MLSLIIHGLSYHIRSRAYHWTIGTNLDGQLFIGLHITEGTNSSSVMLCIQNSDTLQFTVRRFLNTHSVPQCYPFWDVQLL